MKNIFGLLRTKGRTDCSDDCRLERKFYIPEEKISMAAALLRHCCPPDPLYPEGVVHSLYYDTENLDDYEDSEQGSRQRKKIRLRWYNQPASGGKTIRVFAELKTKEGFTGRKYRQAVEVPARTVQGNQWQKGILPYSAVLAVLAQFDYFPPQRLLPTILISYHRRRFIDLTTGARVSLDWRIVSTLAAPHQTRREGPLRMEGAVVEVKGRSLELSPALRSLKLLETDWTRYSKYACCLSAQLEEAGSFGRLMPSGRASWNEYL